MNIAPLRPFLASLALVGALLAGNETREGSGTEISAVERLIELGQTDNRAQVHLEHLSKEIGHRLTSSTNLERAEVWAVEQFRSFGLEAELEKWGEFEVGFDRFGEHGGMLRPVVQSYVFRTPAWTPGTAGPQRGPAVLEPRTMEELEAVKGRLRGSWLVLRPRSERPERDVRRALPDLLREVPILGQVGDGGEPLQVFGRSGLEWDDLPRTVQVRVRRDQYRDLVERLEGDEQVELEFDVDNRFRQGPIDLYNVVADLVGTEWPDEVVIVGGHIDSWHCAQGTQDNGTGVATTLEAARLLVESGARPKRTIRFMLWSGEEQGLLGSKGYVEEHEDELVESVSAVLVHDGGTNYLSGIAGPAPMIADLRRAFEPVLALNPDMPFEVTENEGLSGGGSDHGSFLRAGIPGFFWKQDGRTDYGHVWHTQYDTFEEAVPEYQEHSAMVVALGALGLANLDRKLDRTAMKRPSPRRMGVFLDGVAVSGLSGNGPAKEAGWEEGDVILAIDGVAVAERREIVTELQKGGPVKTFTLLRGEEEIESVLDWTDDKGEQERAEHRRALEEAKAVAAVGSGTDPAGSDPEASAAAGPVDPAVDDPASVPAGP